MNEIKSRHRTPQDISSRISTNWNASVTYLGAVGIGGILTGEIAQRIATVIDGNAATDRRLTAALDAAKVIAPLSEALREFDALRVSGGFLIEWGAYLGALYDALDEITAALFSSESAPVGTPAGEEAANA